MRSRRTIVLLLGLAAVALALAACGGDDAAADAADEPAVTVDEPTAEAPAEPAPPDPPAPAEPEPAEPATEPLPLPSEAYPDVAPADPQVPVEAGAGLSATIADGWQLTVVDEGIKPDLALDAAGSPGIAYISEEIDGWIRFAAASEGWEAQTVAEGYFYGPIGLSYDPAGGPHVVWHDHQESSVNLGVGDLTYAVREGSEWTYSAAADPGHDGWDSTIAIGSDGVVRAAGIEPSQFGFDNGVEYYELRDGQWAVEPVGSGPIAYEFNVSLAVSPEGQPALTYFNDRLGDLELARFDGASWSIETVAGEGTIGMFSSLAFDNLGAAHVSFFEPTDEGGIVHYAVEADGGWTIEEIAMLDDVVLGQIGARRNSAIAIDAEGRPHVVLSDRDTLSYAVRTDAGWELETIATASDAPFGQLVSFELAPDGSPHIAFHEIVSARPFAGLIAYVTR